MIRENFFDIPGLPAQDKAKRLASQCFLLRQLTISTMVLAITGLSLMLFGSQVEAQGFGFGSRSERRSDNPDGLVAIESTDPTVNLGRREQRRSEQTTGRTADRERTPRRGSSFSDPAPTRPPRPGGDGAAAPSPGVGGTGGAAAAVAAAVAAARATGAPPMATPVPLQPAPPGGDGFTGLGWDVLAGYRYVEPTPLPGSRPEETEARRKRNQIPSHVLSWNKRKVEVEGWMVPLEVDDRGLIQSFVLVRTQPECCFGDAHSMNEWIEVRMERGLRTDFVLDRPVRVRGIIDVGELVEDGFVLSLYRMTATMVKG